MRKYKKPDKASTKSIRAYQENYQGSKYIDCAKKIMKIYLNGRIEDVYSVYIPSESLLSQKNVFLVHENTLHGVKTMTVTNVHPYY